MGLLEDARAVERDIVEIRRRVHRRPELGLDLPETQRIVVDELERLGLEPRLGRGLSSVTAVIGSERPGRTVVLRADMDGLPLTEEIPLDFASEIPGQMHACGHDMHVAMLLGAARILVERHRANPAALPGPVLLMFQPGEEGFWGARVMLEEGLLDDMDPKAARGFAIHVSTVYPTGQVHFRPGPQQASTDNVFITVRGRGGHASMPHLTLDPIPVAAEIVLALQVAVARAVDAFDPAVLTIGHVTAGTTYNIVPETAFLEGTIRCVSDARRAAMPGLIRRVVEGVTAAHGLTVDIRFQEVYPVTVNHPLVTEQVHHLAAGLVGEDEVHHMPAPMMASEDWSYVLQRIPGSWSTSAPARATARSRASRRTTRRSSCSTRRRWRSAPPCTRRSRSRSDGLPPRRISPGRPAGPPT